MKDFFNNTVLTGNKYRVKLYYGFNGNFKEYERAFDFDINDIASLNVQVLPVQISYLLVFNNPKTQTLNSISEICYEFYYRGQRYSAEIKIANENGNNSEKFVSYKNADNTTTYLYALSTENIPVYDIDDLVIQFKNSDGKVIHTI